MFGGFKSNLQMVKNITDSFIILQTVDHDL